MAIFLNDFVIKSGNKKYRFSCDSCNKDRGYLSKMRRGSVSTGNFCLSCSNSVKEKCKKCNNDNKLPQFNESNEHWIWSKNKTSKQGGYHRCRSCVYFKTQKWDKRNPDKVKTKQIKASKKYKSTIRGRLRSNISSQISNLLKKRNINKNLDSKFLSLDWNIDQLKNHLESKFQPGMNWANYGSLSGWELDHIIPDSWHNYLSIEDQTFKDCWSLNNLQPLWTKKNRSKSNKFAGGY